MAKTNLPYYVVIKYDDMEDIIDVTKQNIYLGKKSGEGGVINAGNGLVDISDEEYATLKETLLEVNRFMEER